MCQMDTGLHFQPTVCTEVVLWWCVCVCVCVCVTDLGMRMMGSPATISWFSVRSVESPYKILRSVCGYKYV